MIKLILSILPLIIIILTSLIFLGFKKDQFRQYLFSLSNLVALIVNSVLIYYAETLEFHSHSFNIDKSTFILSELILFISLLLSFSLNDNIKNTNHKNLYSSLYFLLISSFIGLTLTTNLIIILIFLILQYISVMCLFFIDEYHKDFFVLKRYALLLVCSMISAFLLILFVNTNFSSVNLYEIAQEDPSMDFLQTIIMLVLIFIIFIVPCGGLFTNKAHKDLFENSKFILIKILYLIQYPIHLILFFRAATSLNVKDNNIVGLEIYIGILLMIIGFFGLIVSMAYSFLELFGKLRKNSVNLKIIIGYQNNAQLSTLICIFSIGFFVIPNEIVHNNVYLVLVEFLILFILCNLLRFSSLIKFTNDKTLSNLHNINLLTDYNLLGLGFISTQILLLAPGLLGYYSLVKLMKLIGGNLISDSITQIAGWLSITAVLIFIIYLAVITGLLIPHLFLKSAKSNTIDESEEFEWKYYLPLIISSVIATLIVFAYYLFNPLLLDYLYQIINQIFI
ncbi:MAG: hypothetical protein GF364_09900 [Candidatus Lokiarchaeota archaeon]|nr:hypothetical protein [Candidatus Lokiarchaeota archaeon]